MKVLLIAEQANPEWVSVPLVGWSFCNSIRKVVPAHIVTHVRNRDAFLRQGLVEGTDFTAIDSESVSRPLYRLATLLRGGDNKGWTTVTALQSLAYYAFENELWKVFKQRLKAGEFSLVHRVTPLSPTSPSILSRRCAKIGVRFMLGPLNGGLPWPPGFEHRRLSEREWLSYIRGIYRLLPGIASSKRYASAILVGSKATAEQIPSCYRDKTLYMPENGIDPTRFKRVRARTATAPIRGVFVGRLVQYKCPDILLKAAAPHVRDGKLTLTIVGDGPMRKDLEAMSRDAAIEQGVTFAGWLDHHRVQDTLAESDFLALPSIREFGGGVVLEAMACGIAPIIADYGGPSELVTQETGFKIAFSDEHTLTENLSSLLGRLIESPSVLDGVGAKARERVLEEFVWDRKAERIREIYTKVIATARTP